MERWRRFLENPTGWFIFQFLEFAVVILVLNRILFPRGLSPAAGVVVLVVEIGLLFVLNIRLRRRFLAR